jgi:hypothetical protein
MTTCLNVDELHFRVFTVDANGIEHDTGKQFSITQQYSEKVEKQIYRTTQTYQRFMREAIVMAMFEQLFGWPESNGFGLVWVKPYKTAYISWRKTEWLIKRIV